jgi:hypothetical protein
MAYDFMGWGQPGRADTVGLPVVELFEEVYRREFK